MVNTAVLFETFARPQYARQVFEQIKKAQPKKFYFYCNKARADRPEEIKDNEEIRSWVREVDWDCELHTFFRDEYVDVYVSTFGAIDWVFKNEEQAIILEDDCVPTQAFFAYCEHFLDKYRNDKRISVISGDNYVEGLDFEGADHIITSNFFMFGWASWRDRWINADFNIDVKRVIEDDLIFEKYFVDDKKKVIFWKSYYKEIYHFLEDTHCWDYMFSLDCVRNKAYVVAPIKHLVQNVGILGTHAQGKESAVNRSVNTKDCCYPFSNIPVYITPHKIYDELSFNILFNHPFSAKNRIKNFLRSIVRPIKKNIKVFFVSQM